MHPSLGEWGNTTGMTLASKATSEINSVGGGGEGGGTQRNNVRSQIPWQICEAVFDFFKV
jgi:hypothetical protein